jgi:hypothetical protein
MAGLRGCCLKKYFEYCFLASRDLYEFRRSRRERFMTKAALSDTIARPFLWPGTIACNALGLHDHNDLVRMLVNSLIWTVVGVTIAALVI